ncbi:MAG: type II secretion system protein GspN [Nitrospiria bacterium]
MFAWLRRKRNKAVVVLGYVFFGLIMFFLFLYLTFPFHLLTSKLVLALEEKSGCEISVNESRLHFPARVVWMGVRTRCVNRSFFPGDERDLDLNMPTIEVHVAPFPVLMGRRGKIDFRIELGDGVLSGNLTVNQRGEQISYTLSLEGEKIDLASFGESGHLDLEGNGDWIDQDFFNGKGVVSLALKEGRITKIGSWTIPIGTLSFSDIRGKMSWGKGRVIVDRFSARGSEVDIQAESGNLILRKPLDGSLVTLTLKAMPKGDLKRTATLFIRGYTGRKPMILGVRGPLRRPQISMNGRPISP